MPGKSRGWRSLVGCSPWGREESDTTERLPFHFSLSCIGEGNGSPLQCSCLENPGDGGAWWAAVSGVAQSRPRMKRLSSSSSSNAHHGAWHSVGTRESLLNLDLEVTVQIPHGPDFRGLPATAPQQLLPPAPGCMANLPQACRTYQGPRPCQSNAYQSRENSPALRLEALQQ